MKKIIFCLSLLLMISAAGCGDDSGESGSSGNDTAAADNFNDSEVSMNIDYSKVSEIKIADAYGDMFEKPLSETLSADETAAFREMVPALEKSDVRSGNRLYYKLEMYDSSGGLIDSWEVDSNVSVMSAGGAAYRRTGKLSQWLSDIEKSHKITAEEIWSRVPAAGYFSLAEQAKTAYVNEVTKTNFDKGVEYKLSSEEIAEFAKILGNEKISAAKEKVDAAYTIELFSESGASLYILYADGKGGVYTEYGYTLNGTEAGKWLGAVIEKAKSEE